MDCCKQVLDERTPCKMNAENLGDLIQNDDDADARLEANQNRLGDEIGNEAQPQERSDTSINPTNSVSMAEAVNSDAGSPPGTTRPAGRQPISRA